MFNLKNLTASIVIASAMVGVSAQANTVEGLVIGAIVGAAVNQSNQPQPVVVYQNPPPVVVYPPQPINVYPQNPPPVVVYQQPVPHQHVIYPDQVPYYDYNIHAYCAPYRKTQYAQCVGNMTRKLNEQAYRRGFYGY